MQYYNVHSHIFNMDNAPKRFLQLYMPDLAADLIDIITNTDIGASVFEKLLTLGGNGTKRYASFLKIGKYKTQMEVFENLMQQYDDESIKFIALSMYMEKCGAGNSISGFEGQLEGILNVKQRYPERILTFMGVDPRWKQSGTELRKTIESYFEKKITVNGITSVYPFAGLKLYPSTGFYVFDKGLKETFEWAADNGVPVLSHCYYRGGIYNNDENYLRANLNPINPYTNKIYDEPQYIKQFEWLKWITRTNTSNNNKNTCSYFLDPASYEALFAYFEARPNPLKLCLAHYAGAEQMLISTGAKKPNSDEKALYGTKKINWFTQIQQLIEQYPRCVYTDVAYTVFYKEVHNIIFDELNNKSRGQKIMFGTDYFMTEQEQPEKKTYTDFKTSAVKKQLPNFESVTAWNQIAGSNTQNFLTSKYYTP